MRAIVTSLVLGLSVLTAPTAQAAPPPPTPAAALASGYHRPAVRSANVQPEVVTRTVKGKKVQKIIGIESGEAKGRYCRLVNDGFNAVTLTWAIEQTTKTSGKLIARKTMIGAAPTPTDRQIRLAIRNAKSCGISYVILKEHLWLPGNVWRAKIPGTTKNQKAYTTRLLHLQTIALQEHAYEVVIASEQRDATTTSGDAARWKATIKTLDKADPHKQVRLSMALHTNDELLHVSPSVIKDLDAVYSTWYPRPANGQSLSQAKLLADMKTDKARYFDKAKKRYGRFDGFAETGFRSIAWPDYYNIQGKTARVDQGLQARQYAAFFQFSQTLNINTVMLYRAELLDVGPATFEWDGKQAEPIIRNAFHTK